MGALYSTRSGVTGWVPAHGDIRQDGRGATHGIRWPRLRARLSRALLVPGRAHGDVGAGNGALRREDAVHARGYSSRGEYASQVARGSEGLSARFAFRMDAGMPPGKALQVLAWSFMSAQVAHGDQW